MAQLTAVYSSRVANENRPSNRIRELREAINMSQAELARLVHADPTTINKLEMGKRGLDQKWMRRIAPHLGVSAADLLPDEDNAWRPDPDERELLERIRLASDKDRETLRKVADAILPYRGPERGEAA